MRSFYFIPVAILLMLGFGMVTGVTASHDSDPTDDLIRFAFDFKDPDDEFRLARALDEISGLTYVDDSTLAAVEDERGIVYLIDTQTGDIRSKHKFGPSGDYEGIERIGSVMYVVNSSGDVYEIHGWASPEPHAIRHKTALSSRFDIEGLAYDGSQERLLVACKEYPGRKLSGYKSVYAYYPEVDSLASRPAFAVNADGRRNEIYPGKLGDFGIMKKDAQQFKPSGLAIDPVTSNLFILSSAYPSIAVVHPDSGLVHVFELKRKLFRQPEGIAFDTAGNLFISNEGAGEKPTLLRFDRIPNRPTENN